MHQTRLITGLIAAPFLIALIGAGGVYFTALAEAACLFALLEYGRITLNPSTRTSCLSLFLIGLAAGMSMIWSAHAERPDVMTGLMSLYVILTGIISSRKFGTDPYYLENLYKQAAGMVYIPLSLSMLVMIRAGADGGPWLFMIIIVVFAGDIGAYYSGKNFGRHKLCPAVSPGKTVEGSIGGLAANVLSGLLFQAIFLRDMPVLSGMGLYLAIGIVQQAGDLFESQMKRVAGIKDSGFILPGHGGMLDRIDALLFAAPVAYLFKILLYSS